MRDFFEWFEAKLDKGQSWVILGKGPSFSKRQQFDLGEFYTLSLNHAVREQAVTVAHMIDYDVVDGCGEAIINNAQALVLPWVPHVNNHPGRRNLEELAQDHPILHRMDRSGRLLWYNLSTARQKHGNSPVIQARYFSAEAALNLLAQAGVRKVRSLGIDGGTTYSAEFDDLKGKTLLANRRSSFDRQFEEIAQSILRTGIDYAPLDIESPIRVFVGATEVQMLPVKVLEYSIRKHTSMGVDVFPLHLSGIEIPEPKDPGNRPRTPFSFQRFVIPALVEYQGRAIYMDSDMLVFKDLRYLWGLPVKNADLVAVRMETSTDHAAKFSMMLLNCGSLKWDIREIIKALDSGELSYAELVYEMSVAKHVRAEIDPAWNSLESFSESKTAVLHYTDMNTQPWVSRENPLGYLWTRYLLEAICWGWVSANFVKEQVMLGHVRPSLLYQIEHRIEDSLLLPKEARMLDNNFVPPYCYIPNLRRSLSHPAKLLRAAVRQCYQKSAMFRLQRALYDLLSR